MFGRHGCGSGWERHLHAMRFHMGPRGRDFGLPGWSIHLEGLGRGGGGGGGRRGRGPALFRAMELRLLLLRLIADEPRHGYDLIRTIEEKSGGAYAPSPGVVYPTLSFLADEGLIEEQAADGARKRFAATDSGRALLDDMKDEVAALLARLDEVRPEPRSGDRQLQRALDNLRTAMRNRVAEADWDQAVVEAMTDILDEAARRIERAK